eukprot:scaffold102084_cov63-Phaeocystis_antarctica.AAC.1
MASLWSTYLLSSLPAAVVEQMSRPENRLAGSVHVVIGSAKSLLSAGLPDKGSLAPKGAIDNKPLHALELLGRDHGVEPREKLLALRLIIERARVLVFCAVRRAENKLALALEPEKADLLVARETPAR